MRGDIEDLASELGIMVAFEESTHWQADITFSAVMVCFYRDPIMLKLHQWLGESIEHDWMPLDIYAVLEGLLYGYRSEEIQRHVNLQAERRNAEPPSEDPPIVWWVQELADLQTEAPEYFTASVIKEDLGGTAEEVREEVKRCYPGITYHPGKGYRTIDLVAAEAERQGQT